jgi:hypothetical protein
MAICGSALRTRDGLGCNDAASADAIFDDERLAQLLGEILTDQPRNPVRVAAGGEWHRNLHRTLRPFVCRQCLE